MISAAYKIESIGAQNVPPAGPHFSFTRRVYKKAQEQENDCLFGVELTEYNNFSFGNKEKMNFKIEIIYESGPNSRFRKLSSKLEIGKLVFITGFLDLDDNELPCVVAKEIDLLDEFTSSDRNIIFQSPLSCTNKFRKNKNVIIKKERVSEDNETEVINNNDSGIIEMEDEKKDEIKEESEVNNEKTNKNSKGKKRELMDLSTQRLKKGRSNAYKKDDDEIFDDNNEYNEEEYDEKIIDLEAKKPPKRPGRKKK